MEVALAVSRLEPTCAIRTCACRLTGHDPLQWKRTSVRAILIRDLLGGAAKKPLDVKFRLAKGSLGLHIRCREAGYLKVELRTFESTPRLHGGWQSGYRLGIQIGGEVLPTVAMLSNPQRCPGVDFEVAVFKANSVQNVDEGRDEPCQDVGGWGRGLEVDELVVALEHFEGEVVECRHAPLCDCVEEVCLVGEPCEEPTATAVASDRGKVVSLEETHPAESTCEPH
mmetsp:Transcript_29974/g.75550  ORF Transcript_29974/g.75550 Transcript_29974/m.75550 type:complete len:226 (+) Transcript_29974:905-1582(+)